MTNPTPYMVRLLRSLGARRDAAAPAPAADAPKPPEPDAAREPTRTDGERR